MSSPAERAALYRQRAADSERRAGEITTEELRRSWLIVARDWLAMAEREEARARSSDGANSER